MALTGGIPLVNSSSAKRSAAASAINVNAAQASTMQIKFDSSPRR